MMVAPSLLMVTLLPSATSLSMPRGPSVVRTASATAWQALMLLMSCALPCFIESGVIERSYDELFSIGARRFQYDLQMNSMAEHVPFKNDFRPRVTLVMPLAPLTWEVSVPSLRRIIPGLIPPCIMVALLFGVVALGVVTALRLLQRACGEKLEQRWESSSSS